MIPSGNYEYDITPEEEKMPSEAAELSAHGKPVLILSSKRKTLLILIIK